VLGADGSLSIEPVEQVSKVVGVIELKANLRYVVHQRWPVRDRIDNRPQAPFLALQYGKFGWTKVANFAGFAPSNARIRPELPPPTG